MDELGSKIDFGSPVIRCMPSQEATASLVFGNTTIVDYGDDTKFAGLVSSFIMPDFEGDYDPLPRVPSEGYLGKIK